MSNEPWWPLDFEEDGGANVRGHPAVIEVVGPHANDPAFLMSDHRGHPLAIRPKDLIELRSVLLELAYPGVNQ
jgi:hypothetical protein